MKVLGISTAAKAVSCGLIDGEKPVADFTSTMAGSEDTAAMVKKMFDDSSVDISGVKAVAVVSGPGSYSGLRGGMAAAKTFAQVLGADIIGISTLEAMAFNLVYVMGTIVAVLDAVKDEANVALFSSGSGQLKRMTKDMAVPESRITELLSEIKGKIFVVTTLDSVRKKIRELNDEGAQITVADRYNSMPYGINVARLGLKKIQAGEKDNYLDLAPNYSHSPKLKEYKHGN